MGHLRWRVLRRPLTFAEGCCLRRHTNVWVWCLLSHISAILLQSLCGVGEDSFAEAVVPRLVPGRQGAGPQFWPTPPRYHIVFHTSFGLASHRLQSWSEAVGVIKVCTGKVALQHPDSSSEFSLECNWETLDWFWTVDSGNVAQLWRGRRGFSHVSHKPQSNLLPTPSLHRERAESSSPEHDSPHSESSSASRQG